MKLVILGVIALVVGLAGGTGVRVFTAPPLPAGADSLIARADSTYKAKHHSAAGSHTAAAHGDAAHATATPADHADHAAAATTPTDTHHDAPTAASAVATTPETTSVPGASPIVDGPPAIPPPGPERYKQVGNILLSMKPVEAARVIAYLNDRQVHGLLEVMGPRQAAQIMAQLPAERAATLSKRLLIAVPQEVR